MDARFKRKEEIMFQVQSEKKRISENVPTTS
jgi:hypothetical protein